MAKRRIKNGKAARRRKAALRAKTPRKLKNQWAGAVQRSRKRRAPPLKLPPKVKTRKIAKASQRAGETVGQTLSRGRMLTAAQKLRAGSKVRVTLKGRTDAIAKGRPMQRSRTFTVRGTQRERANLLLYNSMRIIGKEMFPERGRGYDVFDEDDALEWVFEIVREERKPREKPRKRRRKKKRGV